MFADVWLYLKICEAICYLYVRSSVSMLWEAPGFSLEVKVTMY